MNWLLSFLIAGIATRFWSAPEPSKPYYRPSWLMSRARNLLMSKGAGPFAGKVEGSVLGLIAANEWREIGLLHHFQLPGYLTVALGMLLLDLSFYIQHRLDHGVYALWRVHRVHHSDAHLDVTTAVLGHPLTAVMRITWQTAAITLIGVNAKAVAILMTLEMLVSYYSHANIPLVPYFDRTVRALGLVGQATHWIHHSRDPIESNSNFGLVFNLWDRLFGTYSAKTDFKDLEFGLKEFEDPKWQSVYGLLISPFCEMKDGTNPVART